MDFLKWFLFDAAMKERGELIVNLVICLTLVFAIIYFGLLNGYKLFYFICKETKEKTFKKVLVKGDFGSGKTHYVNHDVALFEFLKPKSESVSKLENYDKKLYISCTGKTSDELLKELYFKLLPKPIKCLEKVNVLDMISHVFHVRKYDVSDIKDYILKSASQKYDVIIIDDFERMCFGESINDEIHQFTRLILEKLENYFHIVFVHSTNSRFFADNQYELKHRESSSDKYYLNFLENFDSNISYLLEKNEWDKEYTCETDIVKCLSLEGVYEKWDNFFVRDYSIIGNFLRKEVKKFSERYKIYSYSDFFNEVADYSELSNKLTELLDYYLKEETVRKMFHLLIMESVYSYVMNYMSTDKNRNSFNYRTALSYANGLIERDIYDFFQNDEQDVDFTEIIMKNENVIIDMYNRVNTNNY